MLFKEIVDGRTDRRTHARTHGRRTLKDHKSSLSTSCSGELKINFLLSGNKTNNNTTIIWTPAVTNEKQKDIFNKQMLKVFNLENNLEGCLIKKESKNMRPESPSQGNREVLIS